MTTPTSDTAAFALLMLAQHSMLHASAADADAGDDIARNYPT